MRGSGGPGHDDVGWTVGFDQMTGGQTMEETVWQCDQMRAGQLYSRMMFRTREEAEVFVRKMQQAEPDQMFSVEAVAARQVWN